MYCAIFSCHHNKVNGKCPKDTFYIFPKNDEILIQWVKLSGNLTLAQKLFKNIKRDNHICSCHFEDNDVVINSAGKTKLRPTSVPSLNINVRPLLDNVIENFVNLNKNESVKNQSTNQVLKKSQMCSNTVASSVRPGVSIVSAAPSVKPTECIPLNNDKQKCNKIPLQRHQICSTTVGLSVEPSVPSVGSSVQAAPSVKPTECISLTNDKQKCNTIPLQRHQICSTTVGLSVEPSVPSVGSSVQAASNVEPTEYIPLINALQRHQICSTTVGLSVEPSLPSVPSEQAASNVEPTEYIQLINEKFDEELICGDQIENDVFIETSNVSSTAEEKQNLSSQSNTETLSSDKSKIMKPKLLSKKKSSNRRRSYPGINNTRSSVSDITYSTKSCLRRKKKSNDFEKFTNLLNAQLQLIQPCCARIIMYKINMMMNKLVMLQLQES